MRRRTFVLPEAQTEISEATHWYESQQFGVGKRFLTEIRQALHAISENPLRFPVIVENLRRALLHKFPYSIYFINETEAVEIIAVLHQHRDTPELGALALKRSNASLRSRPMCEKAPSPSISSGELCHRMCGRPLAFRSSNLA